MARQRVMAVVVTYFPAFERLSLLLTELCSQVEQVVVVDNTPDGADWEGAGESIRHVPGLRLRVLGTNFGIAAAQNVGIDIAVEEGFDYVLFSDQDSMPQSGMVANLVAVARERSGSGVAVGSVCPAYYDETSRQEFRFQVQPSGRLFYRSVPAAGADPWIEIVTSISSGSLIPCDALTLVGGMRDDFFIDDVDTEWCHRARALGFHHFGTNCARLVHTLGDAPLVAWYFGARVHSEYSPVRLYYRFRNFIRMVKLPHVPWNWSLRASWYWLGNIYTHCLFAEHRMRNARAIGLGLWDGLLGRGGPIKRDV